MAQTAALQPGPPDWRRRFAEALRLLGTDIVGADALERADALWLARLLPVPATPAGAPGQLPTADAGAHAGGTPPAKKASSADRHPHGGDRAERDGMPQQFGGSTSLFVAQPGKEGEEQLSARRVQVPVADALPGRAAIERALKPFLRKRPSANRRVVDTQATAEASAQACAELLAGAAFGTRAHALVPVLRPVAERWFDVVLLAERDEAMLAFEDTLIELRNLLARHGAFGQVRLWRWSIKAGAVNVESPSGMPCAPRAMLQSQRPLLALVLTHGASAHWEGKVLRKFVRDLGSRSVMAIVQMLPPKAWGFTALGEAPELVRARERGSVNRLLQRLDVWHGGFRDRGGLDAVPMLSLDAPALGAWADFVMSPRLLQHAAVSLEDAAEMVAPLAAPSTGTTGAPAPTPEAARERVLRFRAIASAQAFALLRLLAGTWITLPVMRLLLHSLPGRRSLAPAAEVLLSGLLVRVSPPGSAAQDMVFDFVPGLREWLHGSLSGEEQRQASSAMAESREAIRRFVEAKSGVKLASFSALLRDPRGTEFLPASARSFLELSRRLRALRGGAPMAGPERGGVPLQGAAAELGALRNFPPLMEGLVPRPVLEDRLAQRVLALTPGGVLRLRAMPGAGVRTLLGNVLRRPSVRSRFGGGIWFDTDPPAEPAAAHLQRLVVRFGAKGRVGGDTCIDVRMQRNRDVDVGHLEASEAQAHLVQMGVARTDAAELWPVHQGVPSLVPIVGAGWLRGIRRWPRRDTERPESNYGALSMKVLGQLTSAERDGLIVMSARRPGYPDRPTGSEALAVQLAWQCRTPDGSSATLHPAVSQFLQSAYRDKVRAAHEAIVGELAPRNGTPLLPPAYLRDHLLQHAIAARGAEGARRVLFDRRLLLQILHGDRSSVLRALAPLARKDKQLAGVAEELQSGAPIEVLADHAREGLAPASNWPVWLGLPERRLRENFGTGVRVAILGTGVDAMHPELQHSVIEGAVADPHGHGTAVASIIAGRFVGISTGARLQSYAALDAQGSGATSTVLVALDSILSVPAEERAHILCVPLGMGTWDEAMARALGLITAQNILVVAAAGNEGSQEPVNFPASMPEVLAVGALDEDGRPLEFSNRGAVKRNGKLQKEGPDLWAPGAKVLVAAGAGTSGGSEGAVLPPARYTTMSGTSFACAVVAGLAARYMELTGLRGQALRELLLARAAEEGRARYVPDMGEPAESSDPAPPSSSGQLASAVPGEDVVTIETSDGVTLTLHPSNAAGLLLRQSSAETERNDLAQPSLPISRIQILGRAANDPSATVGELMLRLDAQVPPALYELQPRSLVALRGHPPAGSLASEFSSGGPTLVFVHGVFLDTASTFGALWTANHQKRLDLFRAYHDRVYAFEYPTLGGSPVAAALTLAKALPASAPVHLATHSSGGLLAEVLARAAAQPHETERAASTFFSADGHAADRRALLELGRIVRDKHFSIDRMVRVACPAKGIGIDEGGLDVWMSLFRNALRLGHISVQPAFEAFLVEAARARTSPSRVPGIASLLPDAPLIQWLNSPVEPLPGDLRVMAGNVWGFGNAPWLAALETGGAAWSESDLVVQTASMDGGAGRRGGSSFWLAEGQEATHFNYFSDPSSVRAFFDALALDQPPHFQAFEPS
ncbi:Thermophilic serine proteinase precursor [Variovorax sp. PBS-H4]|uniref:SAV_2336 N-terminal domain-related protein n=1 Tax=Variovorax sp. PBS-H4 TaxID=434008 RepID=UPI00131709C5|nr:SAV_2336 N-terminal domain-related protein [Variovorax sp. PBS-H4]VTU18128.1 Thermophilic serine proteinase precursor [Variovorax sp. PBS-H4]